MTTKYRIMENVLESTRNWLEFGLSTWNKHGCVEFDIADVKSRIDVITAILDTEDGNFNA